jgi:hypothetical protein
MPPAALHPVKWVKLLDRTGMVRAGISGYTEICNNPLQPGHPFLDLLFGSR